MKIWRKCKSCGGGSVPFTWKLENKLNEIMPVRANKYTFVQCESKIINKYEKKASNMDTNSDCGYLYCGHTHKHTHDNSNNNWTEQASEPESSNNRCNRVIVVRATNNDLFVVVYTLEVDDDVDDNVRLISFVMRLFIVLYGYLCRWLFAIHMPMWCGILTFTLIYW